MDWVNRVKKIGKKALVGILNEFEKGLGIETRNKSAVVIPNNKGVYIGDIGTSFTNKKIKFPKGDYHHKIVFGGYGKGKNTLLENYVLECEHGCAFVDSTKGSSINKILRAMPKERLKKVVVIEHTDRNYPFPVGSTDKADNVFENDMLVSHWENFFVTNFGVGELYRTKKLIKYAMKAVFSIDNTTVLDAIKFVENSDYRDYILSRMKGEEYRDILKYWNKFEKMSDNQKSQYAEPFLSRVGDIEGDTILRTTLGQIPKVKINYEKWVNEGYTVLIKIPEVLPSQVVRVGTALHVLNFWRACLQRGDVFDDPSKQFTVICDEPQSWLGKNERILDDIFSKARAYRMNIICLLQSTEQLRRESPALLKVILDNRPDILALSQASIPDFSEFDWNELKKWHYLIRMNGKQFVVCSPKPITKRFDLRSEKEAQKIIDEFKIKFNRHFKDVDNRIIRRMKRWEEEVDTTGKKSELVPNGSSKMLKEESPQKMKESSDSHIVTNW